MIYKTMMMMMMVDDNDDDDDDRPDEVLVRFKGAEVGGITFLTKVHEMRGK